MSCPHCKEPLLALEWNAIEIDACLACGGVWLDSGELEMILEQDGCDFQPLIDALRRARDGGKSSRRCPRCRRRLRQFLVGESSPLELDRCPWGHGLWFDRGELEKLVGQFSQGEAGAVARFLGEMFKNDLKENKEG
jgi:Zn-finger nucleic acid-binding protein